MGPIRVSLWGGVALFAGFALHPGPLTAQETEDAEEAIPAEDLLGEEELDALVAPVALYPDALLTQIFVAATYPLDIVKADRFVDDSESLDDRARADAAQAEDWDPSIQVLTGGFPDVIGRMADEIDWTEDLGDAVVAQTDDVLDAVQRQRARAAAVGNLETNEAQVVEVDDGEISIAPADPEVVYVPSYDSSTAFTTAATAPPVIATAETGYSTTDLVTTGAIAFGSALLINEIFDDDDDYHGYWGGPSHIDWNDGNFYPRPGIDIDGDVNIDRGDINIDRDRLDVDRDRLDVDRDRVGAKLPDRGDGAWKPSKDRSDEARRKLAGRDRGGDASAARDKIKARGDGAGGGDARAKLEKAAAKREPGSGGGGAKIRDSALKPKGEGHKAAKKAADRGKVSTGKANAKPKLKQAQHAKKISKPGGGKKIAPKKASKKGTAFKKHSGGGKAKAAKNRGGKSRGKMKRR